MTKLMSSNIITKNAHFEKFTYSKNLEIEKNVYSEKY